jgi:hypothetical protein
MMEAQMVNDHFPYIYEGGHWISTADDDRRDQLVQAAHVAAKVALGLMVGWLCVVIFFLM